MASSAVLTASAALKSRVARPSLLKKLAHPEDLIPLFPNGAYIGWSGFTGVGYPKYVLNLSCSESIELPPEFSDLAVVLGGQY
jgi:acyl-CoA hydrolase